MGATSLIERHEHRACPASQWSVKAPDPSRLDAILEALQPTDRLERLAWLFDTDYPDVPVQDINRHFEAVKGARAAAAREIRTVLGYAGLLALADRVRFPQFIAIAAVDAIDQISTLDALIDDALGTSERLDTFAFA